MDSLDVAARALLINKADRWFWGLIWSTIVLFIGVVMEEFHPLRRLPTHSVNTRTRSRTPRVWVLRSQRMYELFAVMLVIAGIGGEGIFEYLGAKAETAVRNFDRETAVTAEKEAGGAELDAANARKETERIRNDTQRLKTDADVARKDAETERLARVKIEERLAWRRINPKQFGQFVAALKPFAGASVFVDISGNGDLETKTFGDDILKLLADAHWNTSVSRTNIRMPPVMGLTCRVNMDVKAGVALAEVLKNLPGASVDRVHSRSGVAAITVGIRPPP